MHILTSAVFVYNFLRYHNMSASIANAGILGPRQTSDFDEQYCDKAILR